MEDLQNQIYILYCLQDSTKTETVWLCFISCVPFAGQQKNRDSCINHYGSLDIGDLIFNYSARRFSLDSKLTIINTEKVLQILREATFSI